jgi:hypothetical protein
MLKTVVRKRSFGETKKMMHVRLTYHIIASNVCVITTELAIFAALHMFFLSTLPLRPQVKAATSRFALLCFALFAHST